MSGHWAALASASIIAALYGGMAAVSRLRLFCCIDPAPPAMTSSMCRLQLMRRMTLQCVAPQLHGRGSRLLHMQAAQRPLRVTGSQRTGTGCQRRLSSGMNSSSNAGAAEWSSVQAYDTFSEDPRLPLTHLRAVELSTVSMRRIVRSS